MPQDQPFDAAVFEDLDRHALHRAEVVGEQRRAPAPVTGDVRQACSVTIDSAHSPGVVEDVRQTNAGFVVVGQRRRGHRWLRRAPGRVSTAGIGYQLRTVTPEAPQVEVEQAFVIDQQRTVPFALKHRAAVG